MSKKTPRSRAKLVLPLLLILAVAGGCAVWQATTAPTPLPSTSAPALADHPTSQPDEWRFYVYGGLPRTSQPVTLLRNQGYLVGYCEVRRNPLWAAYRVFRVDKPVTHDRPRRFMTDARTQAKVSHDDYTNTGYDRGHQAPNYAINICYGQEAQRESFLMSNISPQKPSLNRRLWMSLEQKIARDYASRFEEVWVIVGPVFGDEIRKLPSGVHIPDAFFMILLDEEDGQPRMLAFIVPQGVAGNEPLERFLVSVNDVERQTGLDFFSELEDGPEERLESMKASHLWN